MKNRIAAALSLGTLFVVGCSHPEDRRWNATLPVVDVSSESGAPYLSVYSIPAVAPSRGKTRLRDLSEAGQAALIEAMARPDTDPEKLRRSLAVPLEGASERETSVDRTQIGRTLIITVNKGWKALPGDRLIRTVVTIRPHKDDGTRATFEFTGYTIAATDNKIQDIASLETASEASLSATLAPKLGGFGDNSVEGKVSRSHTTSADIRQQYEHLNVDIMPRELVVTRESERGLDVVGNTFVELTLAPVMPLTGPSAFLAAGMKLYEGTKPLMPGKASLDIMPLNYLPACPLQVDAEMKYLMRRIVKGREYYTEGKQKVAIVPGELESQTFELVRAQEAQTPLFQILVSSGREQPQLFARTFDGANKPLLFDNYEDARRLAYWLERGAGGRIGGGLELRMGKRPLPRGARYVATRYSYGCEHSPQEANAAAQ